MEREGNHEKSELGRRNSMYWEVVGMDFLCGGGGGGPGARVEREGNHESELGMRN